MKALNWQVQMDLPCGRTGAVGRCMPRLIRKAGNTARMEGEEHMQMTARTKRGDTYFGKLRKDVVRDRWLYLMLIPGALFFILFKYLPMGGIILAFKDYSPFLGIFKSPNVGLANFQKLFTDPDFFRLFRNTLILAVYSIVFTFPIPIIIALMLNEIQHESYKRVMQSIIYLPHFLSWVVAVSITYILLSNQSGIVNDLIVACGGKSVNFLGSQSWFRPLITLQVIWKETGWGTIVYLAALTGVDVQLYEAATVDGANRWQQLIHVTLPAIKSTIVVLFILRMGTFLDNGFDQLFLMVNSLNRNIGDVFDTYVYNAAMVNGQFSYSTTVGIFKSVVSLVLVLLTNKLANLMGEEGVY